MAVLESLQSLDWLAIIGAGFMAGAINVIVGAGTLVSFPILLLLGYPPLVATVSNTIGIVPGSAMGAMAYREELRRRSDVVKNLLPASVAGGIAGSLLLLHLSTEVFTTVIPWLIGLGTLLVLLGPAIKKQIGAGSSTTVEQPEAAFPSQRSLIVSIVGALLLGTYGGYFSAAQGILLIALLGISTTLLMQELNAIKNLTVAGVNVIAATMYIVVSPGLIAWNVVGLVALGATLGGLVGARVAKKLPASVFRGFVGVVGTATVLVMIFG